MLTGIGSLGAYADDVARGDAAWGARARGETEGRPAPGPILDSIGAYERALEARPDAVEARWKLLRSLHFAGTFVSDEPDEKHRHFERATEIAEDGLERLAQQTGDGTRLDGLPADGLAAVVETARVAINDVARLYFWAAINWGAWSRTVGLLGAVRRGVANRLHRYTQVTLALEPAYEDGGAYRLLGRLHASLPRVPFLSGWVDRDRAIPLVERAFALAPEHPGNRLLLAMTLLDLAPARRAEALDLLSLVASLTPRPSTRIEDLAMRDEARELLEELGGGPSASGERRPDHAGGDAAVPSCCPGEV